jgi:hypothetical protein
MNQIHSGKQAVSQRLPERLEGSRNGSSDLEWVTKTTRFWTGRSGIGNCLAAAPQAGNIFFAVLRRAGECCTRFDPLASATVDDDLTPVFSP